MLLFIYLKYQQINIVSEECPAIYAYILSKLHGFSILKKTGYRILTKNVLFWSQF